MPNQRKISLHDVSYWLANPRVADRDALRAFDGAVTAALLGGVFWLTLLAVVFSG